MTEAELDNVLTEHKEWLDSDGKKGKCADLRDANLCDANLCGADLREADLHDANLCGADLREADLRDANLCDANLCGADLREADLHDANLCGADLREADLHDADLRGADLRGANLDYADWPLWCGSLSPKIDARLAAQLMYHAMRAIESCSDDADVAAVLANADNVRLANRFHRVDECRRIKRLKIKKGGERKP